MTCLSLAKGATSYSVVRLILPGTFCLARHSNASSSGEAATASCAFDAGRRRPWRDGTSALIRAAECRDLTGHRTDAVDSQQLVGTRKRAQPWRRYLFFVSS